MRITRPVTTASKMSVRVGTTTGYGARSMGAHFLIVTNGARAIPPSVTQAHRHSTIIAVDGGLGPILAARLRPSHVLGDFDSASPEALERARNDGATLHPLPTDKDATDLEFALDLAVALLLDEGHSRAVTVVSGPGDRFDHLLAEMALLASPKWRAIAIDAIYEPATVTVMWGPSMQSIETRTDELITLMPCHGSATVSISGVRWELDHATLLPGSTHGVSNEATGAATVTVHNGCLLVVRPFGL
jgi:thiamine pyrophosphokinase